MRAFWPPSSGVQDEYESLRETVLSVGVPPDSLVAARFGRAGLTGLIVWPSLEPAFSASLIGARRPSWTPNEDPRELALAEGYELLLGVSPRVPAMEVAR